MAGAGAAAAASLPPTPPVPPGHISLDAPVSPAPGHAVPVSVSDVEDAVAGRPVTDPQGEAPVPSHRAPAPRNSRFNDLARPAAAGAAAFPSGPVRPSFNGPDDLTVTGDVATPPSRGKRTPGARRLLVLAGTVAALALVTYSWTAIANHNNSRNTALPTVIPASGKCVVSYTVVNQVGNTFTASLVVANRDTVPVSNWNLWWVMPGDQVLSGNGQEKLYQQDRGVTVSAATATDTLAPQQTKSMTVTGKFSTSNAAPMVFQLDNKTCEAYVSGKPGDPSRPVQQLSDGTTRLGPVPTSSTPVPGISINPSGVAVITKVTPTPAKNPPTGGATFSPSPNPGHTDTVDPTPAKSVDDKPTTAAPTSPDPVETSTLPKPTESAPASICDPNEDPDC
jgi:serine/threonine-protein kinase